MDVWITGFFLKSFISFGHQLKEVLYGVYVLKVVYLEPPQLSPPIFEGQPPWKQGRKLPIKTRGPIWVLGLYYGQVLVTSHQKVTELQKKSNLEAKLYRPETWEPTYPFPTHFWVDDFLFPRWDMLVRYLMICIDMFLYIYTHIVSVSI